jgi:uncharacterized membrane protein YdjX (TVP38/TMEM64 family)
LLFFETFGAQSLKIDQIVKSGPLRLLLGIFLAAFIVLIFYTYNQGVWMEAIRYCRYFFQPRRLQAYVASFGPFSVIVFVLLQSLQVIVAPIPGEVTGFIGGLLFGTVWGSILSTAGLLLGSLAAFALARVFGVKLVRKIVSRDFMDRFNRFTASNRGFNVLFLFFLIPGVPKDSVCYLLGLGSMSYLDFILINVFARLPGTVALTLQGNAVRHGRYGMFFTLLLVTFGLLAVIYPLRRFFLRSFHAHSCETENPPLEGKQES